MPITTCPNCQHRYSIEFTDGVAEVETRWDFAPRMMLRLSEIATEITLLGIMKKAPSRNTLIDLCEKGVFDARLTSLGWLVFQDSFDDWVRDLQQPALSRAA